MCILNHLAQLGQTGRPQSLPVADNLIAEGEPKLAFENAQAVTYVIVLSKSQGHLTVFARICHHLVARGDVSKSYSVEWV